MFNPTLEEHGWQSTHTIIEIVNDDMPFLVDSVTMEANRHGLTLHLIMHPLLAVARDADGTLTGLASEGEDARRESFIHVEVDRVTDAARLDALAADIARVLATCAWRSTTGRRCGTGCMASSPSSTRIRRRCRRTNSPKARRSWAGSPPTTSRSWATAATTSSPWTAQDALRVVPGSSLGILRETERTCAASFAALPPEHARVRAPPRAPRHHQVDVALDRASPGLSRLCRASSASTRAGKVVRRGSLPRPFTSTAYSANPADIPLLRRKTANVVARAGLAPGSHAGKALHQHPRHLSARRALPDGEDDLLRTAMGILHLDERQRFRLFVRRDPFERFVSCLIFAPRENYTTELRQKWQAILMQAFNGTSSEFNVHLSESMLARIQITVRTTPGKIPDFDVRELEARLAVAARPLEDDLKGALIDALGEARGNELLPPVRRTRFRPVIARISPRARRCPTSR